MSTPCNIIIHNKTRVDSDAEIIIYQHYDGSPDVMLDKVTKFVNKFTKLRTYYDYNYLSARLLQYLMNESDKSVAKDLQLSAHAFYTKPIGVMGFSISNEPCDASYIYHIYSDDILWCG